MTRKDYIAISTILHNAREEYCPETNASHIVLIDTLSEELADMLAADNARFNRARFLTACGVQS